MAPPTIVLVPPSLLAGYREEGDRWRTEGRGGQRRLLGSPGKGRKVVAEGFREVCDWPNEGQPTGSDGRQGLHTQERLTARHNHLYVART